MNDRRDLLQSILGPAGPDAGCDGGLEVLDLFVEAELAGRPADALFPDVAVHIQACPDCREDYEGLRELARSDGEASTGAP
ncbi:MAG TPA: hypothetical protein VK871_15995 [Candidatus Limnocylindrales bacterium]|nr:hypothetical protein [Candidatus Limnocylindrales bacterium]